MATAYLIGGTPRTGKTTLATQFITARPVLATSADALRYSLRHLLSTKDEPDLFRFDKYVTNDPEILARLGSDPSKALSMQTRESAIVWRFVKDIIASYMRDECDVLIEGIVVMPEFVLQLTCDYKAVFLGNQSEDHVHTIRRFARENPGDWMHTLADTTIDIFAGLNIAYSRFIREEATKHQLPYVEVHDDSFQADIQTALDLLLT